MSIKSSSVSKKPTLIIKNKKYFGFALHTVPKRFASTDAKQPIKDWFNFKGYTFISRDNFVDMYGNYTIE